MKDSTLGDGRRREGGNVRTRFVRFPTPSTPPRLESRGPRENHPDSLGFLPGSVRLTVSLPLEGLGILGPVPVRLPPGGGSGTLPFPPNGTEGLERGCATCLRLNSQYRITRSTQVSVEPVSIVSRFGRLFQDCPGKDGEATQDPRVSRSSTVPIKTKRVRGGGPRFINRLGLDWLKSGRGRG